MEKKLSFKECSLVKCCFIVNRKANYNDYEGDIFPLITPNYKGALPLYNPPFFFSLPSREELHTFLPSPLKGEG